MQKIYENYEREIHRISHNISRREISKYIRKYAEEHKITQQEAKKNEIVQNVCTWIKLRNEEKVRRNYNDVGR